MCICVLQCTIFKTLDDKDVWGYDKRFYVDPQDALKVPLIKDMPPFKENEWKFIEGNAVTRDHYDSILQMIRQMNAGIRQLEDLSVQN